MVNKKFLQIIENRNEFNAIEEPELNKAKDMIYDISLGDVIDTLSEIKLKYLYSSKLNNDELKEKTINIIKDGMIKDILDEMIFSIEMYFISLSYSTRFDLLYDHLINLPLLLDNNIDGKSDCILDKEILKTFDMPLLIDNFIRSIPELSKNRYDKDEFSRVLFQEIDNDTLPYHLKYTLFDTLEDK